MCDSPRHRTSPEPRDPAIWLGAELGTVPARDQAAVFAWVYGASLREMTEFAELCALRYLSGNLRYMADDIASRVADDLVMKPLPAQRIGNWRVYVDNNVRRWKVVELVRWDRAGKRHGGPRADDPDAVLRIPADDPADGFGCLEAADLLETLLAQLPDRYAPVFRAVFAVDGDGFRRRTILEAADLLGIPDGTVRRISAQGMPVLRGIAAAELARAA